MTNLEVVTAAGQCIPVFQQGTLPPQCLTQVRTGQETPVIVSVCYAPSPQGLHDVTYEQ